MSDDMNDDKLHSLRNAASPSASAGARERALEAAMLAFDAAHQENKSPAQGAAAPARLTSIFQFFKGNWIMDTRFSFGLGTAAVALLLLPLGYQLYTSTAMTPFEFRTRAPAPASVGETIREERDGSAVQVSAERAAEPAGAMIRQDYSAAAEPVPAEVLGKEAGGASNRRAMPMPQVTDGVTYSAPLAALNAPSVRDQQMLPPQVHPSGDSFADFDESPVKVVAEQPVSTFSIDVDTASYAYVRRLLNDGYLPDPDAVRIEEMINYFDYGYAPAENAEAPFRPTMQVYPTPWNPNTQLLQIGIKGHVPPVTEDRASNLVLLIDTSGSMESMDRLPLLKRSFGLLVDQLGANDTVSIVTYAGSAGVALPPTSGTEKATILAALNSLAANGSTAGAAGIELAYQLAEQNAVEGGINRVLLATDGDFNVGIEDPRDLEQFIKSKRDAGIYLSVLGFGMGNLGDDTMQALAQNGNGNASYIDSFKEAQKVLVMELSGTLETIATDVKIQVEFNPAVVAEYRLVGYETRALNREDFNNDRVDAGDIGAGHTVTAIYEITPVGSGAELVDPRRYGVDTPPATLAASEEIGFLKMRYKLPGETTSALIEAPISESLTVDSIGEASEDARWAAAAAAFAQKLKGSVYGGDMTYDEIRQLAQGARGEDKDGYRAEFIQLIGAAATFDTRD